MTGYNLRKQAISKQHKQNKEKRKIILFRQRIYSMSPHLMMMILDYKKKNNNNNYIKN